MNSKHDRTLSSIRDAGVRFVAAIGPKPEDPHHRAISAASFRLLAAIGPNQDDPSPKQDVAIAHAIAEAARFIEAIGPKQDGPVARAIFLGGVARFADEIGPKQDDPHHPGHLFRAWIVEYLAAAMPARGARPTVGFDDFARRLGSGRGQDTPGDNPATR